MKKVIGILIIILIINLGITFNVANASEASISVSSATEGKSFTVTINMPSDVVGYGGTITVKYSDGTSKSEKIADVNTNLQSIGNVSKSYTAPTGATGNATITVSNLTLSNASGNSVNSNKTISKTFTVASASNPNTSAPNLGEISNQEMTVKPSSGSASSQNTSKTQNNTSKTQANTSKNQNNTSNKNESKTNSKNNAVTNNANNTTNSSNATNNTNTTNTVNETDNTINNSVSDENNNGAPTYEQIENEIGILPEVGKNKFDKVAIVYMIAAMLIVIIIFKLKI